METGTLRVAMVVPSIGFGSSVDTPTVALLARSMASVTDLHLFPIHAGVTQDVAADPGLTVHPVATSGRFSGRLMETVQRLRGEHRRRPFDVIHALWLHEPGTIAVAAGRLLRVPVVASIGGAEVVALPDIDYGALRSARGRLMTAYVLQHATIVGGGSRYVIERARRIVPHRDHLRFRWLPLPVDVAMFDRARDDRRTGGLHVLHAASLIPVKDQVTLIRAFRRVVDLAPEATLTIAGEDPFGHRTELEHVRDHLMLGDSVRFVGRQAHEEMPGLYHAADLFALSSRHESQGMVVCEAAASGIPTVGTDVGVVRDLAPKAAVAVRPRDTVALGDAIYRLLTDQPRRLRLGQAAHERIERDYDAGPVRDAFFSAYHHAIALHGQ